jgi:hypothetical protein
MAAFCSLSKYLVRHCFLFLQGNATESGPNSSHFRGRKHDVMGEFFSSTIPILAHTALLLGLEKIT